MKKYLLSLAMSFGLIATSAYAVDMSEVENLDPYFEKAGLEISAYDKVLIAPLGVGATFIVPPPWVTGADASAKLWALTEADERWLRESYQQAVRAEIGQEFEVVDEAGEGVLIVRIELISLMPFARKGEDVQTQGFGVIVAQAQLRDGNNGELLAVYEGPQRVGQEYQQNTRLNAETSLTKLFEIWGARVRIYMESHTE
jgi:hypothetical protein